ncbi:MAG TPA: HAMP domain-containing sensor histidine kinase [Saprospiraceae bacterium]|nr:HAMP domain-containing sensor histidine kinase [Saprospiraceae bacterium]HMQ81616.1 HAMP domain-containing sensor histidine kinase [Saprospiraceae bacterium]
MNNSTILRVMFLGALAIMGIIAMQAYWVVNTWNINEEEFNNKVNLALYNVARSLAELNEGILPPRNIVNRRTTNYYVVNIESEIDANNLEYFLQKEFEKLALYVDFEYAVFDCHTNEMVYGNYCSYSPLEKKNLELGDLPQYNEFTYYFGVKFPSRSGYLFGKMQLSVFFSVILLLTIIFFAFTMFVILRQKRLSELQKDFINNMTHEFKTPISTVKIAADVLMTHPRIQEDERLSRYANIVKEQNQRLNNQVEKVLQLAKIEQGSFELKPEWVEIKGLLQNIVESVAVNVEKLGGTLTLDAPIEETLIKADRLHLTNILHNLLDNAIKYCRDTPQIVISAALVQRHLQLRIADQGIGISKENLPKVFQKFYRIPTGNVHKVKGFGLGLYYVKSICEAHGWEISLDSQEGQGTTVHITIPQEAPAKWFLAWTQRLAKEKTPVTSNI